MPSHQTTVVKFSTIHTDNLVSFTLFKYRHLDGNHKLIEPYRIVIHGYSRLIIYLNASSNNKAATVLQLFLNALQQYNLPSRVRTDTLYGNGKHRCITRYAGKAWLEQRKHINLDISPQPKY